MENVNMQEQDEASILEQEHLLDQLGSMLRAKFDNNAKLRDTYERRMLDQLRQYYGKYDGSTVDMSEAQSKAFINITRNKTNAAAARLQEMLIPNNGNEKNWGIRATPVPELEGMDDDQTPVMLDESTETTQGDLVKAQKAEAAKRAEAMSREIDDQLSESNYAAIQRDVIFDACRIGTGVVKGPILIGRERRVWRQVPGSNVYELAIVRDLRPRSKYVNPIFWYPDMSATQPDEREFDFEVSFITRRALKELLKYPGYLKEQIKKALQLRPSETQHDLASFYDQVRAITGDRTLATDNRYYMIEYYGPVSKDMLMACGCNEEELPEDEQDPVGMVVMVGGIVIKADIHPMAKGESIYDVFNWEEDESSLFGFGVPYQMQTEQRVINSAYRMVLDNGGLSTGPQVLYRKGMIRPADGEYKLTPRKIWEIQDAAAGIKVDDVFKVFDIPCRLGDLLEIANVFRQLTDEVTNLPLIAQGEQTSQITQTYQGMALLMNSANIVIRRAVKAYDDWITKRHIGRYYDWNMEFNPKSEIKGDLEVIARGTSSLLQREQELIALQMLIQVMPVFAGLPDPEKIWKRLLELNSLDPEAYTLAADARPQQQQDPSVEIKMAEMQQEAQLNQAKMQLEAQRLQQELELGMARLAVDRELTLEQLYKKLGMEQQRLDVESDMKATELMDRQNEMALKMQMGSGI